MRCIDYFSKLHKLYVVKTEVCMILKFHYSFRGMHAKFQGNGEMQLTCTCSPCIWVVYFTTFKCTIFTMSMRKLFNLTKTKFVAYCFN